MSKILEELEGKFTRYEVARILGARALQIAMDAPLLLKISEKELEEINYNPLEIAKRELLAEVLPITVNRPLPSKREEKLKILPKEKIEELKRKEKEKIEAEKEIEKKTGKEGPLHVAEIKADESLEHEEQEEEKKIEADAEIMELVTPEDEVEETSAPGEEEA